MIILDTNVLSELMRPSPSPSVVRWTGAQAAAGLYTTSITQAEILHGILLLPAGRKRAAIEAAAESMFTEDFRDRILPFSGQAAREYARVCAERRRLGRPIAAFDAQIAAIARATGFSIATRNVDDYTGCGIAVIDPWRS